MAVTINARGTSVPYFKIGKSGTTFYQGDADPSNSYTINTNDIWFDTSNNTIKFRVSNAWSGITTASDLTVTGDLTVQGTTTTVNSTEIQVQNTLKFEGSTSNDFETTLTVTDPTADRTITLPNTSGTVALTSDIPGTDLVLDTTPQLGGDLESNSSNIKMADSDEIIFGTDSDANIKHTGTNLNINETTGDVNIRTYANDKDVVIGSDDGSGGLANYLMADGSTGELKLFHYGSEKIKTTATGVEVTGNAIASGTVGTSTTGAIVMPVGTTAQRPGTGVVGMMRFNSDIDSFEGYNGASWVKLGHTIPTGDSHNFGAISETSDVASINYGAITDTDTDNYTYDRGLITDADIVS